MDKETHSGTGMANLDEELWHRRYRSFVRLYKGREDVVAEWREGKYIAVPGASLTFHRFMDHVQLKTAYAIYNKDDAGRVSFGLFDADVLPRNQGWEELLRHMDEKKRMTIRLMETLEEMGLERRNLLVEFPTVGFHLLWFFDQPVPARALKTVMRFALERAGLEGIPFYPRQVENAPWGDRVQLPLRINVNTSRRSNFVRDLQSFDPERYDSLAAEPDYAALDQVVPIPARWVGELIERYGLDSAGTGMS